MLKSVKKLNKPTTSKEDNEGSSNNEEVRRGDPDERQIKP